jgi:hypothetical protein
MLGCSFALDRGAAKRLLDADEDDRLDVLDDIEEKGADEWTFDHDKAWEGLQMCLGDGTLDSPEPTPLPLQAVLGGDDLLPNDDEERFARFVPADRVPAVAAALDGISREWLLERFDTLDHVDYSTPEDFEYVWENLEGLRAFFHRAATARRAIVFSL